MYKKVISIMLLSVLALSIILTGCSGGNSSETTGTTGTTGTQTSGSTGQSSASNEKVTIKLMHRFPDEPFQGFIDKVCQQYESAHPNVTIKQTSAATDPYKEKLTVMLSSGTDAPDVFFGFSGEYLNQFVREGKVLDLTPYWEKDKAWADSYMPQLVQPFYTDNKLYGVPYRVSVKMFFYNKKIFQDLNLSTPQTWDELLAVCKKLKDAGYIPIGEGTADQWPATHYLAILNARCVPADILKKDYDPKTGEWTDPGYMQALDLFKQLVPYMSPHVTGQKHDMGRQQFVMGQAAMMFAESVEIPFIDQEMDQSNPVDYGMFAFPSIPNAKGDQNAILGAPEGFSVYSGTKNPDVAVDFLKYLCGQEVGKQEVKEIKWFNACKNTVDPATSDAKLVDCYNVMVNAKSVVNWMDNEVHALIRTVYYEDTAAYMNGTMTAQQFMDKIRAAAQKAKQTVQ